MKKKLSFRKSGISVSTCIYIGMCTYKKNIIPLTIGSAIISIISLIALFLYLSFSTYRYLLLIFELFIMCLLLPFWYGLCLKISDKKHFLLKEFIPPINRLFSQWSTYFVFFFLFFVGSFILIVPGIIIYLFLGQSLFLILDKTSSLKHAILDSIKISKGKKKQIFLLTFLGALLIYILQYPFIYSQFHLNTPFGVILFFIGSGLLIINYIFLMPIYCMSLVILYKKLIVHYNKNDNFTQI